MSLHEVDEAASLVQAEADEEADIIFGAVIDETIEDELRITVIATGFEDAGRTAQATPKAEVTAEQPAPQAPAPEPVAEVQQS